MNLFKQGLVLLLFAVMWLAACTAESPPPSPTALPSSTVIETASPEPVAAQPTALPTAEATAEPAATATTAAAATAAPTETPTATATTPIFVVNEVAVEGTAVQECDAVVQPALLFNDTEEASPGQATYLLHDLTGGRLCRLYMASRPQGQEIIAVGGLLYYTVFDWETSSYTVWQDDGLGQGQPLTFTQTPVEDLYSTYFHFLVSDDGRRLAWTLYEYEGGDAVITRNRLWLAESDGRDLRQLRDDLLEGGLVGYYEPLRFTDDGRMLYAHQPLGLGGGWDRFFGRYQTLYALDLQSGESELLFSCESLLCLGDISADGRYLAYTDSAAGLIHLITWEGEPVQTLVPPGKDYAGYPTFATDGRLFLSSADINDTFHTDPGYISVLAPPYNGSAETFYQAANITTINQIVGDYLFYWTNDDPAVINLNNPFDISIFPDAWLQAVLP